MEGFWRGFEKQAGLRSWAGSMVKKIPGVQQYLDKANKPTLRQKASELWHKVPGVQAYIDKANSPAFKVQKVVGTTALGVGGTGYALHKLTSPPPVEVTPQQAGMV